MSILIKNVLKHILKGVAYSIAFAIVGAGFSFLIGWEFLKGAYMFVLGAGVVTMIISAMLLVGTPKTRKEYFARKDDEAFKDKTRGGEGIGPAMMGLVMMIIGFAIEALMH